MKKITKKGILEELGSLQNALRLMDCDLATILGISNSYLTNIRKRVYVSPHMGSLFRVAISFFRQIIKSKSNFHFGQHLAEPTTKFRERRAVLTDNLRKKFVKTLEAIDKKKR